MSTAKDFAIYSALGSTNLLLVVPHGRSCSTSTGTAEHLAALGHALRRQLDSYAVVNSRYKQSLVDMTSIRAIQSRKPVAAGFLRPIERFKEEISGNGLHPLIVIFQEQPAQARESQDVVLGYGQGERRSRSTPHRPTLSPSQLNRLRLALEDQGFSTGIADVGSGMSGCEGDSLNQYFRLRQERPQQYDPAVSSLLVNLAPSLFAGREQAVATAGRLAGALQPLCIEMPLVRQVRVEHIDTDNTEDARYIFRLPEGQGHRDLTWDASVAELAGSIARSGLLHPLALLQKEDGRYRILCGYRRLLAIRRLGQQWVEAKVFEEAEHSAEELFHLSLAENTKRRNLNPLEIGNFLESASGALGLSNAMLAERFGATLGIGVPGERVSQSTIHKYRKVNQVRLNNESPEMINDLINGRLQFSVAAEVLAPMANPEERDALYLEMCRPLSPTRPQLQQIVDLLRRSALPLDQAIRSEPVQRALAETARSGQKARGFLRRYRDIVEEKREPPLPAEVERLRTSYFGEYAGRKDFDLVADDRASRKALVLRVRLHRGDYREILGKIDRLLTDEDVFDLLDGEPGKG